MPTAHVEHDSFNYQLYYHTVRLNEMSSDSLVPETKVLAIASHVGMQPPCHPCVAKADTSRLYMGESTCWPAGSNFCQAQLKVVLMRRRYVGNTMAAFVMQVLGCEVAALNTVQFSMTPIVNNLCERMAFLHSS